MRSFPDFEYKSLTKHWSDFFTYHGLFAILYFGRFYTILHFPKPCIAAHKNSNYPKGIKLCKECEYFVMEGGDPRLYLFRILNKAVAVGVTSVHSLYSTNIRLNWQKYFSFSLLDWSPVRNVIQYYCTYYCINSYILVSPRQGQILPLFYFFFYWRKFLN